MCYNIPNNIRISCMSIVYQKDKRSGITYAYENKAYWDSEKKQSRSKRKLIGRLDEETGEIVKTDGRCAHLSKEPERYKAFDSYSRRQLIDEIIRLRETYEKKKS